MKGAWITDLQGAEDFTSTFLVTRLLYAERTAFQQLEIYESPRFGRMLVLDGAVQTTEADEFTYHEMLTHPALCTHPAPSRVLIIGGGDGGILEEALKHPLTQATLVEIDEAVVRSSRSYLGTICKGAFDDPRTRLVIGDGIAYVAETAEQFDVVLVDSTDPVGPAEGLFARDFYARIARRLTPHGLLAVQSGSAVYQQSLMRQVRDHLRQVFPVVRTYLAAVLAYPGVLWSFTVGSRDRDPAEVPPEEIARRVTGWGLRCYTPGGHLAAFDLPPFLREAVEAEA